MAFFLTSSGCVAPRAHEAGDADLPADLERVLRDYENAWQARDAAALAALFTDDGWVLSSGRPPTHGRAAIEQRYAGSGGPLALRSLHWERVGDLAIIVGGYAPTREEQDRGKFTLTLRRGADGRWRILSDMDNGN
ncbi:MAG: DUF4440 domain-containing protein, partial [Planctomycetes bacterium]|nr:DUF4440 domain-containing protein [Planctomycetota bacterium]